MVYLLKSPYIKNQPDDWLCGGVLVSTIHVLSSASCLTEVSHMYVIAGYKKYVSGINVEEDECTRRRKQKIVKIVILTGYSNSGSLQFNFGLGVAEKPYNFFDVSYRRDCSYEPEAISINYAREMEKAHKSVLILGWGEGKAPKPRTSTDVNSGYLMVARTMITSRSFCRRIFSKNITGFILCVHGFNGVVSTEARVTTSSTTRTPERNRAMLRSCDEEQFSPNDTYAKCLESFEFSLRRTILISKEPDTSFVEKKNDKHGKPDEKKILKNRIKSNISWGIDDNFEGICQNIRGGPLVAFAGHHPLVVGVGLSSAFNEKHQCKGPFFYLSTARSSVLIKCLLSYNKKKNKQCQLKDYEVKEYPVYWPNKTAAVKRKDVITGYRLGSGNKSASVF